MSFPRKKKQCKLVETSGFKFATGISSGESYTAAALKGKIGCISDAKPENPRALCQTQGGNFTLEGCVTATCCGMSTCQFTILLLVVAVVLVVAGVGVFLYTRKPEVPVELSDSSSSSDSDENKASDDQA